MTQEEYTHYIRATSARMLAALIIAERPIAQREGEEPRLAALALRYAAAMAELLTRYEEAIAKQRAGMQ